MKITKKVSRRPSLLVFLLCASVVNITAQDFKTVHDGVEYAQVIRKLGSDPVKINLLRLDLKKVRLDVHHAMDAAIGTEKTSSIATRHGAVAAINAGFFRLDKSKFAGDAAAMLMIDGDLLSENLNDRVILQIDNMKKATNVFVGRSLINTWFGFGGSATQVKLSGLNRERKNDEFLLYGPSFGRTTLVDQEGIDIVLSKCRRTFKHTYRPIECRKAEVITDAANTPIPADGYVISISPGDFKQKRLLLSDLGMYRSDKSRNKTFFLRFEDANTFYFPAKNEDIVAGVPQLIKNGKIDITWEQEKASKGFAETRHPRTAVAKLKDGKFLMITVDGRQPGVSVGMNLQELAEYLFSLGAVDAMNLDGGGSTTMFLDGKVVNTPSDKEGERKIGDAILVTLRTKR
ncbi:MAG: phosphodiester glycosidase family protein [Acidobacteria bacterium]|nr:phosphodiester glycosidase family protein [Acidobacteriota bacterium]